MQETQVQSLGWEDLLEMEMATHSSSLAWKIPRTEEPGRPQSMGLQRAGHDWATPLPLLHLNTWCIFKKSTWCADVFWDTRLWRRGRSGCLPTGRYCSKRMLFRAFQIHFKPLFSVLKTSHWFHCLNISFVKKSQLVLPCESFLDYQNILKSVLSLCLPRWKFYILQLFSFGPIHEPFLFFLKTLKFALPPPPPPCSF